ncbi:MAG: hypothetical protein LN412_06415 [Candidatus Thermoplasmatota archaeon]|nr:hypothetical protein [Candidatus Thermoplasmatota archaeon]
MKRPDPHVKISRFAVVDAAQPSGQIGSLDYYTFREESPSYHANKHLAYVELEVLRSSRRRGVGRTILAEAAKLAKEHGKEVILSSCFEEDGMAFIRAINAQVALKGQENRLFLDRVEWQMVERWAEEGPTRSPYSTLQWFTNRIDESIIVDYSEIYKETANQVPLDDLDVNDIIHTPESFRVREARIEDVGGTWLTAITREAKGQISGLTEMIHWPDRETMIQQGLTGVKEPFRGSGLGKWLKAAMLLRVRREFPQVKVITTTNATSNAPMLSINQRLGFKIHRETAMAQIGLEALEAYLGS